MEKCGQCPALNAVLSLLENKKILIAEQQKIIDYLTVYKAMVDMLKQGDVILN